MNLKRNLFVCLLCVVGSFWQLYAKEYECGMFYLICEHEIIEINPATGATNLLFADCAVVINKRLSRRLQLSPSCEYYSFSAGWYDPINAGCEKGDGCSDFVVILNRRTKQQDIICNGFEGEWAPDEDQLAIINRVDDGNGYSISSETWICDTKDGTKKRIFKDVGYFFDVAWSKYDERVYVRATKSMVHDPATGKEMRIELKGPFVSPDGNYAFNNWVEDSPCELYRLPESKIDICPPVHDDWPMGVLGSFVEWQKIDNRLVAYVIDRFRLYYIDCVNGKMYETTPPSPDIDPIGDLVGFREGRPVWAKIRGDKAELFYY